jgi:hypothetical protein
MRDTKPEISACRRLNTALAEAADSRSDRRIVHGHGPSGTGKTTSCELWIAQHRGSKYVRMSQIASPRMRLAVVSQAVLGYHIDRKSAEEVYERCRTEMLSERVFRQDRGENVPALFIDEADRLAPPGRRPDDATLQILRDLAEDTGWLLVLISVQRLASAITNTSDAYLQTITTRIGAEVRFEPPSVADAQLLADDLVEDVKLLPDLVGYCLDAAKQSLRPLLALYAQIEKYAKAARFDTVGRKEWHDLRVMAGLAKDTSKRSKTIAAIEQKQAVNE